MWARWIFSLTFCLKVLGITHLWPLKMIPSCTASSSLTLKYSETSFGTELLFSGHPLKITFLWVWRVGTLAVSCLISLSCCSEIAKIQCKKSCDSSYYGSNFTYLRHNTPWFFFNPPCPHAMLPKRTYCIPQGTTITRVQHCLGGRGILIEQRPFFLILLFDMQILKKNISCVATILLRIAALQPRFKNLQ